jgi:hypothetical protein
VFGLGLATKIYVAVEAVDMRKGFEGLYGLVRDQLGADPVSGHLFPFTNKTRTRLKALVWDGSALWACAKRLEKGRFQQPSSAKLDSDESERNGGSQAVGRPSRAGGPTASGKHLRWDILFIRVQPAD